MTSTLCSFRNNGMLSEEQSITRLRGFLRVIANWFKIIFPNIIGQEQVGFNKGRNIVDNVIITQEVLHSMRSKGTVEWMAVKIDLEKAYDRINGTFKADLKHSKLLKNFLGSFCEYSGHKEGLVGKITNLVGLSMILAII
ncbi:Retrovirus-related Pol polyprotein LINE-1 [Gossypium australe]|uniref:Retrovirus-related Pol polyprotein LINE-1 n=1 Tax=Gossypium australe TaxID=47621 RepID=A0A5B6WHB9_9ROSI|nr:Retrovirus-related Pol polyprotein LINE-1 [Gossypium australe]